MRITMQQPISSRDICLHVVPGVLSRAALASEAARSFACSAALSLSLSLSLSLFIK